jgi:hypothetical protein
VQAGPFAEESGGLAGREKGQRLFDHCGRKQKAVAIESIDTQDATVAIMLEGRAIIRKRWPHLRVAFENACLGQCRHHGVGCREQFQGTSHGDFGTVIALDAGDSDNELALGARHHIHRIARMQQPQHVTQLDLGCVEAHDLAANTAKLRPVALGAHTATVHDDICIRQCGIGDHCVPVARDLRRVQCVGNGLQQLAVIDLRFPGQIERMRNAQIESWFQGTLTIRIDSIQLRFRVAGS